jgi:BirA family biotin operon repressor/biotin-[acetyl-CoA-carboxylase] ligase
LELTADLTRQLLEESLPGHALRVYPALLSTEADALAWARAGAPDGAVVVAGYQASPRGRAGLEWRLQPGRGLGFSLVLRPRLPLHREGWLYVVALTALADALSGEPTLAWPDEVRSGGARAAAVAVQTAPGTNGVEWAVVSVLVEDAEPPRAPLLARAIAAVLADCLRRCETLGRRVRARLIPMGPSGTALTGKAVTILADGALVIETDDGRRLAVRPQSLGLLDALS